MSLFIEVYVGSKANRKKVAECIAHNVSNLADTSDYIFRVDEFGAPQLSIPNTSVTGRIEGHNRNSSVWSLAEKMIKHANKENGVD